MHTTAAGRQRQVRGFVIAWLGITLLMGALTFVGIYYATGLVDDNNNNDGGERIAAAVPVDNDAGPDEPVLEQVDATTVPTAESAAAVAMAPAGDGAAPDAPAAQDQPPAEAAAQESTPVPSPTSPEAAAPAEAAPTEAEVRPIDNKEFQLGIQVQPNPDPEVYSIWMGEVKDKLRLRWIKQQVRWEQVEPEPGQYNWSELDTTLQLAAQNDINVMLSVLTTPDWAREPGNQRLDMVGPPADPAVFANFLTTMLQRYPGQIHAIEVWNEMNIDREWASVEGLSAANYVEMLRVAYDAIKAVDPGIIVISGALSPTGLNDGVGAYDDFVYMDMLIQAGMLETTDCVGAHHNGYNIGPNVPWNNVPNDPTARFRGPFDNPHHSWSFYSTLNGYAQKIQQAGSDIPLCVTEFGWAVTEDLSGTPQNFEFADDNTLAEQAQYFNEAIQLMDDWGFVWLAFIWNLNYGPQSDWAVTGDNANNVPYSLLRPEWRNAPAYEVIAQYDFRSR